MTATCFWRWLMALPLMLLAPVVLSINKLPEQDAPFTGHIGLTLGESTAAWPEPVKAPKGAPNIVVILLDDVGFAASSSFGGVAATPALDKLAEQGLRFNNFHTTSVCAATRASLLTGRNHHAVGFGQIDYTASGFPGYNAIWPKSAVSIAALLNQRGYSTAAFGKWHNTPHWEIRPLGPFERWPTGLGFDYFYGILRGQDSQWEPELYRNTLPVEPPKTAAEGYHFTTDITDQAIAWLHTRETHAADTPYFLYFATGATHAPHHVAPEWVAPYKGKFDQGWDALREEIFSRQKQLGVIPATTQLTARPSEVPAWGSLSTDTKKIVARQMEVFAGFMTHTDYEVGRLLEAISQSPDGDNTLIFYIVGDNGGGAAFLEVEGYEHQLKTPTSQKRLSYLDKLGGVELYNDYALGWSWANSTPFKYWKKVASHFGGTRDPLIVSWPKGIKTPGELRTQFSHVTDIVPTILELTGIRAPSLINGIEQKPVDGSSLADSFGDKEAPSRHTEQYFEMFGHRAFYKDGWVAASRHRRGQDYRSNPWELYHVATDFSQSRDLAETYPKKLKALQTLFKQSAQKNNVYPLNEISFYDGDHAKKKTIIYYPDSPRLPIMGAPNFLAAHRITASLIVNEKTVEGNLLSYGDRSNGFTLYINNGQFVFESVDPDQYRVIIQAPLKLPRGSSLLSYEFQPITKPESLPGGTVVEGTGKLYINHQLVGESRVRRVKPHDLMQFGNLGIGRAYGSPVSKHYTPPFAFTGELESVRVEQLN